MNSLELKVVMNILGISSCGITNKTRTGTSDLYTWNGLNIRFGGTYYTMVSGKVPLEVAQRIYDKYPNNPFEIRVAGGHLDNKPLDYCSSDEYENFIKTAEASNIDSYINNLREVKKAIVEKKPESLYIESYHIDSKEGVLILLTELHDYYARKANNGQLVESQVDKQFELFSEVNKRLIEQGNPYVTTEEWLEKHNMVEVGDNKDALEVLPYLTEFDNAVNPFGNPINDVKSQFEHNDKVKFELYNNPETDYFKMSISDKTTMAEHMRTELGRHDYKDPFLTYGLYYKADDKVLVHLHHYISVNENENVVYLTTLNEDSKDDEIDLRFDLISGLAYRTYAKEDEKLPITEKEKKLIVEALINATEIAKDLTLVNLDQRKI